MLFVWSANTNKEEGGGAESRGERAGGQDKVKDGRCGEAFVPKGKTWDIRNNMASRSSFSCSRSLEIEVSEPLSCES